MRGWQTVDLRLPVGLTYGAHKKPCRHVAAGLKLQAMGELHLPMTQDNDDESESYDLAEAALCWDVPDCY